MIKKMFPAFAAVFLSAQVHSQCNMSVTVTPTDVTCPGNSDGSAVAVITGGTGPYSYYWNSNPPQNTSSATNLPEGFYSLTVIDAADCIANAVFSISAPIPLIVDAEFDTVICDHEIVQLQTLVFGGTLPYTYHWSCNQNPCHISDPGGAVPYVNPSQTTEYYFHVTDGNGCTSDTDTLFVNVNPLPAVDAGTDVTVYYTESTQLVASASAAGQYQWSPADSLNDPQIADPIATPGDTTTYMVVFTDNNGCQATDSVTVNVDYQITIPTGMSPNGDNINDTWEVKNLVLFPDADIQVYNRYGDIVFESEGYAVPWDGTYNSEEMPAGPYFYVIDLNSPGVEPFTGTLTLIR